MTTTTSQPSREELRKIRCARLLGGGKSDDNEENQQQPAKKKVKVTMQNDDDYSNNSNNNNQKKPPPKAASPKVIDLMDDSSSSDNEEEEQIDDDSDTTSEKPESATVTVIRKSGSSTASNHVAKPSQAAARSKEKEEIDLWSDSDTDSDKKPSPKKSAAAKRNSNRSSQQKKAVSASSTSKTNPVASRQEANKDTQAMSFQVATYNLWFGPMGDGNPHVQARMQAVLNLLLKERDDVSLPLCFVGFQEIVVEIREALFPLLESVGYRMICQPFSAYGVALAVHKSVTVLDSGWKPYGLTRMDRGFVYARCRLPNGALCLVTSTHLESFDRMAGNGSAERAYQLNAMETFCNRHVDDQSLTDIAIMMGDLNWDDGRKNAPDEELDDVLSSIEWKDAWTSTNHLRPTVDAKKGYTYDCKLNPCLGGNLRRRFDRCLVRGSRATVISACLIGQEALPGLNFEKTNPFKETVRTYPTAPSDHFGLVVQLQT